MDQQDDGITRLTPTFLKNLLKSKKSYYMTPELNDALYLQFKGIRKIENLEEFTGLKSLYIESNEITKLEGLDKLGQLIGLYAQENCISEIEGLSALKSLKILNLSSNQIRKITGLEGLANLESLRISGNFIGKNGIDDVIGLLSASSIKTLDISKNYITEPKVVTEVFAKLPNLGILYLQGNDITNEIKNYRKSMIVTLRGLKRLDDMPVFDEDRRYADAFMRGGLKEEREERAKVKKEKEEIDKKNDEEFNKLIEGAKVGYISTLKTKEEKQCEKNQDEVPELESCDPVEKMTADNL